MLRLFEMDLRMSLSAVVMAMVMTGTSTFCYCIEPGTLQIIRLHMMQLRGTGARGFSV